jgi:hypothetical protein
LLCGGAQETVQVGQLRDPAGEDVHICRQLRWHHPRLSHQSGWLVGPVLAVLAGELAVHRYQHVVAPTPLRDLALVISGAHPDQRLD